MNQKIRVFNFKKREEASERFIKNHSYDITMRLLDKYKPREAPEDSVIQGQYKGLKN